MPHLQWLLALTMFLLSQCLPQACIAEYVHTMLTGCTCITIDGGRHTSHVAAVGHWIIALSVDLSYA